MATIVYPVAAFTSGFKRFHEEDDDALEDDERSAGQEML